MKKVARLLLGITAICALSTSSAGTKGTPEDVRQILVNKYIGSPLDMVILDLGAPVKQTRLDSGARALTWVRSTNKDAANRIIGSDERCVITMLTETKSDRIAAIGKVDDSLGAWQISYCKEQYNF